MYRSDTYVTGEGVYFWSDLQKILLTKKLNTDDLVKKAFNQVYNNGKVNKSTNKKLFVRTYEPLKQAVNEGFGKIITKVEWGTPNYEFLKQLQYNAASFAAFKNHANVQDMVAMLKDEQGNRRSKEDFIKEALKVDDKYNIRHLSVEYDMAVRQSRSAAQWQQALATKKLYPNIKYLPSVSATPREDHAQWYGIIRPIDDPFWDENLPPSEWGCKCGWEVTDETETDIPDNLPDVNPEFAFNPGKTGQIFDLKETGYADNITAAVKDLLVKEAKDYVNWVMAAEQPYVNVYKSKAGTNVVAHPIAILQPEFNDNLNYARQLANATEIPIHKLEILPELKPDNPKQAILRDKYLPNVKPGCNPDYRIDGKYIDLKELKASEINLHRTIGDKISEAHHQADGVVLIIEKKSIIDEATLYRNINGRFNGKNIKDRYKNFSLYLKYDGRWQYFNQKTWLEFYNAYKSKNPQ